jgi:hypothetical protein
MNKDFEQIIQKFKQMTYNIEVETKCSPHERDKPSCHLFLTTSKFLGSMCVWSSGECEIEILNASSGERVWWDYSILTTSGELEEKFEKFSSVFIHETRR